MHPMQMKPWMKNIIRMVAFGMVLLLAVTLVGHYLMPHSNRYLTGYTAGGILGEDFDTVDVLVMGDSNAAQAVSPMIWYREHGITGYTYAVGWMSVFTIYYRLLNIFEEQNPKVVFLSTAPVYTSKPNETYLEGAAGDVAEELLPLMRFHDNWKTLNADNIFETHDYTWRDINKGYTPLDTSVGFFGGDYMYSTAQAASFPMLTEFYLDRIAALCDEHDSELVLLTVPCAADWTMERHNGIAEYAEARGLTYLDYNLKDSGVEIDWHTDTPDSGVHLNLLGAAKISAAMGEYLAQNYTLEDHRGEAAYADWDEDAEAYAAALAEQMPVMEENAAAELANNGQTA